MEHSVIRDGDLDPSGVAGVSADQTGGHDCAEILHGLNNVLASMLLNAQVMEWKLPSYSRSRRYLHEIEHNAQRGGELVKRLLDQLQKDCPQGLHSSRSGVEVLGLAGAEGASVARDLEAGCAAAKVPNIQIANASAIDVATSRFGTPSLNAILNPPEL